MKHNTWLTVTDSYSSTSDRYYIYNFPVRDPEDEAEMGFYLSMPEEDLSPENVKSMGFSFNNANIEVLEDEDYIEVIDKKIKSLLNQQASIVLKNLLPERKKNAIRDIFTLSL